ncbi:M28 family metallopeptidase [Blastococcus colisei]|nr:M20/M25/M40 family metallo-hydrolase [Blastococcus colisei]
MSVPGEGASIRLGDQVFEWAADGRAVRPALVTQVGRSFQVQHPEVPVLLDHGRHLVVDLVAGGVPAPRRPEGADEHADWRIEHLPAGAVVVVDRPSVEAGPADDDTAGLLAGLSPQSFDESMRFLTGLPTRHSWSTGFGEAADWSSDRLAGSGFAVTRHSITVGTGSSANVVGELPGTGTGDRAVVLVTAHLDSVNTPGGPSAPAPGADDNGSGSAGALELGRVLAGRSWRHDLRVILFGGEEQGLHGSRQYVAALAPHERARIRAVLNLDMVGSLNTAAPTVLLEGAPLSAALIDDLARAAATWTGLAVETSLNPFASDHVPFLDGGIPAVLTIEGADSANKNIHSDRDVLATVTTDLAMQILRMDAAALAGWLQPVEAGQKSRAEGSSVPLRTA